MSAPASHTGKDLIDRIQMFITTRKFKSGSTMLYPTCVGASYNANNGTEILTHAVGKTIRSANLVSDDHLKNGANYLDDPDISAMAFTLGAMRACPNHRPCKYALADYVCMMQDLKALVGDWPIGVQVLFDQTTNGFQLYARSGLNGLVYRNNRFILSSEIELPIQYPTLLEWGFDYIRSEAHRIGSSQEELRRALNTPTLINALANNTLESKDSLIVASSTVQGYIEKLLTFTKQAH